MTQHEAQPYGFVAQPSLERAAIQTLDGPQPMISVSYIVYRHPEDRAASENEVALTSAQRRALDAADASTLDAELKAAIRRVRYPALWDAVRTRRDTDDTTVTQALLEHVAAVRGHPAASAPATEPSLRPVSVRVEDGFRPGVAFDDDAGLVAFATMIDGQQVSVVYERAFEHLIDATLIPLSDLSSAGGHSRAGRRDGCAAVGT